MSPAPSPARVATLPSTAPRRLARPIVQRTAAVLCLGLFLVNGMSCSSSGGGTGSATLDQPGLLAGVDLSGPWQLTTVVESVAGVCGTTAAGETSTGLVEVAHVDDTFVLSLDPATSLSGAFDLTDNRRVRVIDRYVTATETLDVDIQLEFDAAGVTFSGTAVEVAHTGCRTTKAVFGSRGSTAAQPVRNFVQSVSAIGARTSLVPTAVPEPAGGPTIQASGATHIVEGGASTVQITSAQSFDRLALSVDSLESYFLLTAAQTTSSAELLVEYGPLLPPHFTCYFRASFNGVWGEPVAIPVRATQRRETGLHVALSWDSATDLDLHLIEPDGFEIWHGNMVSPNGGQLDRNANANCGDTSRSESVTYATGPGSPPSGHFLVRVTNAASCGNSTSTYTIRVNRAGRPSLITVGEISGVGFGGGLGSGQLAEEFEF